MGVLANIVQAVVLGIGKVEWKTKTSLSDDEKAKIKELLGPNYYIICTRRKNHLSTYFIALSDLILRGKLGYYSHVLMNIETGVNAEVKLIEAVGQGVKYSTFDEVFDCTSVALLKPKAMSATQWTAILDKANSQLGRPYDTLFNLSDDSHVSCVEMIRDALMAETNYATDFAYFEKMITGARELTPQMFYDCPDFEVVYEVRK